MNYSNYEKPEMEIDLVDIAWKLLSQWKAILLAAIVIGLLVPMAKLVMDEADYEAAADAQKKAIEQTKRPVEERIAGVLEELPEEDTKAVMDLIKRQKLVDQKQYYLDNSVMLNLDPFNVRRFEVTYYILGDEGSHMQLLADSYNVFLKEESVVKELGKAIDKDAPAEFINELYWTNMGGIADSDTEGTVYKVCFYLTDNSDAKAIERTLDTSMERISKELQNLNEKHTIKKVKAVEKCVIDMAISDSRTNICNSISSLNAAINTGISSLNVEQKAAFETIKAIINENGEIATINNAEFEKPCFSMKYLCLGAFLGIFLYAGLYLAIVLVKGRLMTSDSLPEYTGSRLLGEICYPEQHKGLDALMNSKFVEKVRYRNSEPVGEQINRVASIVDSVCEHAGVKELSVLHMVSPDGEAGRISNSIIESIASLGIKTEVIDVSGKINEKVLLPVKNAVLITCDKNKVAEICDTATTCDQYDIRKLGNIYIRAQ